METRWLVTLPGLPSASAVSDVASAAAFEVLPGSSQAYVDAIAAVGAVATRLGEPQARAWVVLLAGEPDRPVNRAIGFWRRHGLRLGDWPDRVETSFTAAGRITRIGAHPVTSPADFVSSLHERSRVPFRPMVLLPASDSRVMEFLETAVRMPRDAGYRFIGGAGLAAAATGGCLLTGDETDRHQASVLAIGDRHLVTLLKTQIEATYGSHRTV